MVYNINTLIDFTKKNIKDYKNLKYNTLKKIKYNEDEYDFNFIITARGRSNFTEPLFNSVINSSKNTNKKIQFTLFEHSNKKEHEEICEKLNINYLYYKSNNDFFNKCLSYNLSVLCCKPSKWFIFHDIDCLVQKDFFSNLIKNINNNTRAIQTFHKRRVLYLNDNLTNLIINKKIDVNSLNINTDGVSLPKHIGAPGGSIAVESKTFFNVGGYDPELFHSYAPEDAFFWDKLSCLTNVRLCENPHNELFHMNHPVLHNSNPSFNTMSFLHKTFKSLSNDKKNEFLNFKKELYG